MTATRTRRGVGIAAAMCLVVTATGCGSSQLATDKPDTAPSTSAMPTGEDTGGAADGAAVFATNCQSCHGVDGAGGHVGPNLQTSDQTDDRAAVAAIVRSGRGQMPAFEGTLDDEELDAVVDHVVDDLAPMG